MINRKHYLLSVLIQLILLSSYSYSEKPVDITAQTQIHALRIKGQLNEARDLAISYLQNNLDDVDVMLELGLVYFQQSQWEKARFYLQAVLVKSPKYLDARIGLIRVELVEKKYQRALALIDEGLKQNPSEIQLLTVKNQVTNAQEAELKAQVKPSSIQAIPFAISEGAFIADKKSFTSDLLKDMDARIGLIKTEMLEKKYAEALDLIQKGLILSPQDTKLIQLRQRINQAQQSVAPPSEKKAEPPILPLIKSLRTKGQIFLAKDRALTFLKDHPQDVDVLLQLGLINFQEKNNNKAAMYFNQVLDKTPSYLDARIALIKIKILEKKYEEGLDLIRKGLLLKAEDKQLRGLQTAIIQAQNPSQVVEKKQETAPTPDMLKRIKVLREQGDIELAKEKALSHLKEHPEDVDVMLQLALIYLQEKNLEEATVYFNRVLIKTPSYLDARVGLIKTKILEKKYEEAQDLINKGLLLKAHDEQLTQLQTAIHQAQNPTLLNGEQKKEDTSKLMTEIKALREKGQLELAKDKAEHYLKEHSEDVDIQLLLGLIYFQQKDFSRAEKILSAVLNKVSKYVDARLALIKIKISQKNYKEATTLVEAGLKITSNQEALLKLQKDIKELLLAKPKILSPDERLLLRAQKAMKEKNYDLACHIYTELLCKNCFNIDAVLGLADYYLAMNHDYKALHLVQNYLADLQIQAVENCSRNAKPSPDCLTEKPDEIEADAIRLLIKKGEVQRTFYRYGLASKEYQVAACLNSRDKSAQDHLKEIRGISSRYLYGINEVGASSDNTYVTDIHQVWDYSVFYYSRETDIGLIMAKVIYAARLGERAPQIELDFSPQFNHKARIDFVVAYANKPELFPKYVLGAEGYLQVQKKVELSLGDRYSNIGPTHFSTYTTSINYYPKQFWLSFRPYYFVPKRSRNLLLNDSSNRTIMYTGVIRRYFKTVDHFLSLGIGAGLSPDLSDLLTVNFIVIRNRYVNLTYEFPIFHHCLVVDLGAGYQNWQYPNGRVRKLYDGNLGIKYRF